MFCPSCGANNAQPSGHCTSCGQLISSAPGSMPIAAPAQAMFPQPLRTQEKRGPSLAVMIAVAVALFMGGFGYLVANIARETPDKRIGRLMREAAGLQPVRNSLFPSEREFDTTFRDQYRNLIRVNRDYVEAVKNTDLSAVKALNTPQSFADPDSFSEGLKELHTLYDLDMGQEQKVREIVDNIRHAIETNTAFAFQREALIKGFDNGIAQPLVRRKKAVATEQAWVQSIDDVYGYAQSNHMFFILQNGRLVVTNNQVRTTFNARVDAMNTCQGEFRKAKREFDDWQAGLFQKMGVSGKDIGLR